MVQVAVFDYGAGNIFSLKKSLERCGAGVDIVTSMREARACSGILLPGVGHFDPAVRSIRNGLHGLAEWPLPTLGICLGMEAFFERSEEGDESGLGIMAGDVVLLPDDVKVPHMGWNNIKIREDMWLLDGVDDDSWVYFVHSYAARPASDDIIVAYTEYGDRIPAIVQKDTFVGTQFHPEKSGAVGRMMIENFLKECKR